MLLAGFEGCRSGCEGRLQERLFKGQLEAQEELEMQDDGRNNVGDGGQWGKQRVAWSGLTGA